MLKSKYLWVILLFGIIFSILAYGYLDLIQSYDSGWFDETEFLKTHYQGVDCSSLVGDVLLGDYGIPAQSACAGERAWYENNVKLCNLYQDGNEDSSGCRKWMAVKTGDLELCKPLGLVGDIGMEHRLIKSEINKAWRYGCEQNIAEYRDVPSICNSIPYSSEEYRRECKARATDGKTYLQFTQSPIRFGAP
jgi:hypothetical protein